MKRDEAARWLARLNWGHLNVTVGEIEDALLALTAPTTEADARIYPCDKCGKMRTKAEGGTTFTVCDTCWDDHYKLTNPHVPARGGAGNAANGSKAPTQTPGNPGEGSPCGVCSDLRDRANNHTSSVERMDAAAQLKQPCGTCGDDPALVIHPCPSCAAPPAAVAAEKQARSDRAPGTVGGKQEAGNR